MKKNLLFLTAVTVIFILSGTVFAQLAMKLELNKKNYIQYERIYTRLTVKNQSGHLIVFGDNEKFKGEIKFEIETKDGKKLKTSSIPLYKIKNKLLNAGERETFCIPLTVENFQFKGEEEYKVKAIVSHGQLSNEYESNEVEFSIVNGNIVWTTKVGVPSVNETVNSGEKIKNRDYSIISYHDGDHKFYYLMVQDDKYVYGLTCLGFDIGTRQPECMVDRLSRLHILLQAGPRIYSYFIYDINCKLEEKTVYKQLEDNVIKLFKDENTGRINVAGAIKASEGSDYIEETVPDTLRTK